MLCLILHVQAFHTSRNLHVPRNLILKNQNSAKIFDLVNDKEARYRFHDKVVTLFKTTLFNIKNDFKSIGDRESIVLIQFVITFFCIFGMPLLIAYCVQIGGMISLITGLYFMIKGMWDLNENLTLFLKPIKSNVLVTTG